MAVLPSVGSSTVWERALARLPKFVDTGVAPAKVLEVGIQVLCPVEEGVVSEEERRTRIEEETRAQVYDEIGQVTQAQVVVPSKDDNGQDGNRRNRWICAGVVFIGLALSIGLGVALSIPNSRIRQTRPKLRLTTRVNQAQWAEIH
jgi:hypothetical protein